MKQLMQSYEPGVANVLRNTKEQMMQRFLGGDASERKSNKPLVRQISSTDLLNERPPSLEGSSFCFARLGNALGQEKERGNDGEENYGLYFLCA
jgi:hypothetical protein